MKEIKLKKIKPLFTRILTTMNAYEDDVKVGGIITKVAGSIREYQKVIAIGDAVRNIKEGDIVCVDPSRYGHMVEVPKSSNDLRVQKAKMELKFAFDTYEVDGKSCLLLQENDIKFVVPEDGYEEYDISSVIVVDKPTLIV